MVVGVAKQTSLKKVENENLPFTRNLLIKIVHNSGGGRLVDNMKDVESRNCTSIFYGLTLRVATCHVCWG
jgi:hypothetical protein